VTHVDLFTGIGGFALAAKWAGFRTVVMCEINDDLRGFLENEWRVPVIRDVREFPAEDYRGADLLTAGVPCQPASVAGKRRGAADDRWLWPQSIDIIERARPRWCLLENPVGIVTMGLDGIIAQVENLGYTVGTLEIPACAVEAPQERMRVWLVANRSDSGLEGADTTRPVSAMRRVAEHDGSGTVADGNNVNGGTGTGGQDGPQTCYGHVWRDSEWIGCADGCWRRTKPGVAGLVYGISAKLRRAATEAFGNAIVPAVAYEIIRAIMMMGAVKNHG